MSRSNYSDDLDEPALNLWRGAVHSAIRGTRGQKLLRDMLDALDAMPVKRLIAHELEAPGGEHCALGVLGKELGLPLAELDPEDYGSVACAFGIADALAREIAFENDEAWSCNETPERRWQRMRNWVAEHVKTPNV